MTLLGVIYGRETILRTHFIRTGRTIELIESTLSTFDKQDTEHTSIILRAWRMATYNSAGIAASEDAPMLPTGT